MSRAGRITKSVALGAALLCAASLTPRTAAADPDRRGGERRETREVKRDRDRHERRDADRHERRDDRSSERRHDRHYDRHHGPGWQHSGTNVIFRRSGPPVVYCPPPPRPVRMYYDPYCRTSYASLALFTEHAFRHGHLSFVWVLEGGQPRYAYRHAHNGWVRCNEWWPSEGWHRNCD
jgi:hypothetical protein